MNRKERPEKTASKGEAKKQTKASKTLKPEPITPEESSAERETEATDEEYMALIANLPSFPRLLLRITEETSDIVGEDKKAQECDRILREVVKQIAKWDAKAMRSEEGKAISSRVFLARYDSVAERIALSIEAVDLVDRQMAVSGLPADSLERLSIALLIELKEFLLVQHVAGQFPDEQRDLVGALLLALSNYQRGQQMRAANERKRELTAEERDELIERFESTLKHLPAIVHTLFFDDFEDYLDLILDPPRLYEEAWKLYYKLYRAKHRRRPVATGKLDRVIVEEVMQAPDVPKIDYRAFRQGLIDERRRFFLESERRRKANPENAKK